MKTIVVIIAPGFEEIEAVTPIDILRRAGLNVILLGVSGSKIIGSHGIEIECDCKIDDYIGDVHGVVIPGGMPGATNISKSVTALSLIKRTYHNGDLIAAICASPGVVLGSTSILDNKNFTCYPGFENRVVNGSYADKSVIVDNNVITSRGPGSAMAFSLEITKYLLGKEKSDTIAKALLYPKIS